MLYKTLQDIPLDIFKKIIRESISRTDFFKKLNMNPRGAKFKTFKKIIEKHKIDISHFKNSGEINRQKLSFTKHDVISKMLTSNYHNKQIKKYIIKFDIIPYCCSVCGIGDTWRNSPLSLQLDHINGICDDNRLENLRFLCPNCHSQTPTFSGRNKTPKKVLECPLCNSVICEESRHCIKCSHIFQYKINWPSKEELSKLVWEKPLIKLSLDLGVSDNSIRKRCKFLGIPLPPRGHWIRNGGLGR